MLIHVGCGRLGVRFGAVFVATLAALLGAAEVAAQSKQQPPTRSVPTGSVQAAIPPPGPVGLWIDHTGRGAIEIVPCDRELCGRIVWMRDPNDKTGKPLLDSRNEDKSRRGAQICGLQIIGGLKQQPDGSWDYGWIYDPEQGESFDLELRLLRDEALQVKGYKGLKFLNETFRWQRAADTPGPRCAI